MYMVMLVLDDTGHLDAVLDAWCGVGVSGATIVESTGVNRRQAARRRVYARYNFENLSVSDEGGNYTLFAIVPDEAIARACLAAAEGVIGDLGGANTGVLAAWPLTVVKGVPVPTSQAPECD